VVIIHSIVIEEVGRTGDCGHFTVGYGKDGATVVAKPQLTYIKRFEKVHLKAGKKVNTA